MPYYLSALIAVLALIPGIAASVIPGVPAILYMLGVAILYGYADRFAHLSAYDLWILAVVAAVTLLVDFLAGMIGAKWGGAHWSSILWGLAGLVAGSVAIPVPFIGSLIGMFLGVLASEWHRTHDIRSAERAARGSFFGWLAGTGFKVLASVVFLLMFLTFVFL